MAITLSGDHAIPSPPLSARLTPPQVWGIVLLAPYILVFLAFVVYPVGYGLWLARHPASYVALWHDPIFARAAVNTLIFLVIGINVKMAIALFLSGFFAQQRTWIKWLSVLFILPWAVPSIPTILSVRFMSQPGSMQAGIRNLPGAVIIGGGLTVEAGGSLLGAIGVSGAPGGDADEACAKAGIDAVRDRLDF